MECTLEDERLKLLGFMALNCDERYKQICAQYLPIAVSYNGTMSVLWPTVRSSAELFFLLNSLCICNAACDAVSVTRNRKL
jgi:hypothetical protein